jgi:hypothetical protein
MTSVLGWTVLFNGEPVATTFASGVPGLELMDATLTEGARESLCASTLELADGGAAGESFSLCTSFEASGVVSRFSLPGCGLFELDGGASTFFSGDDLAGVAALVFTSSAAFLGALTGVSGAAACAGRAADGGAGFGACLFSRLEAALSAGVGSLGTGVSADGAGGTATVGFLPMSPLTAFSIGASDIAGAGMGFSSNFAMGVATLSGSGVATGSFSAFGNSPGGSVGVARRGGSINCPKAGSSPTVIHVSIFVFASWRRDGVRSDISKTREIAA